MDRWLPAVLTLLVPILAQLRRGNPAPVPRNMVGRKAPGRAQVTFLPARMKGAPDWKLHRVLALRSADILHTWSL